MDIQAINLAWRLALLTDDTTVPITHLFDSDGNETDSPSEAIAAVAGSGGLWFAIDLTLFTRQGAGA